MIQVSRFRLYPSKTVGKRVVQVEQESPRLLVEESVKLLRRMRDCSSDEHLRR
jgi:hypothetical protein